MEFNETKLSKGNNNFDIIRLIAAFMVFFDHSFIIFTGKQMNFDPAYSVFNISTGALGVCVFFSLSGYLIASSFQNSRNILVYFLNRFYRIVPAYSVTIILTILFSGIFLTNLDFQTFFFHPLTKQYWQNLLVFRNYYYLPEVFLNNPLKGQINGSLWTIPYEVFCYLILPIIYLINFRKTIIGILIFYIFNLFLFICFQEKIYSYTIPIIGITMKSFFIPYLYFLSGLVYYTFRNEIKFNYFGLFLTLIVVLGIILNIFPRIMLSSVLIYLVLYFAYTDKIKLNNFSKYGDFSYGFYLYSFPIQQVTCSLFLDSTSLSFKIFISFILISIFAIFSWFCVEKPINKLKSKTVAKVFID